MSLEFSNVYSKLGQGQTVALEDFDFKNIDEQGITILKQIDELIQLGNIKDATKLLTIATSSGGALEKCALSDEDMFHLIEELYNTEILALSVHQDVYRDNEKVPPCKIGDIWLSSIKYLDELSK